MHSFQEVIANRCLWCAVLAWFISQVLKGFLFGLKDHQWKISNFTGSGGMPSSHTAAVTALALTVGAREGFATPLFAACALFAAIVMYDAAGVRRETGKQGKAIKELLSITMPDGKQLLSDDLKEKIGHSPVEIVMGVIIGALCALGFR